MTKTPGQLRVEIQRLKIQIEELGIDLDEAVATNARLTACVEDLRREVKHWKQKAQSAGRGAA